MSVNLRVEVLAGSMVEDVIVEILLLSRQLKIMVSCNLNDVELFAMPSSKTDDVLRQWHNANARSSERRASADAIG